MQHHSHTHRLLQVTFIMFMLCLPLQGQTRHALVIGLGEQQDKTWQKINGDRDVSLVVKRLRETHYSDITTLINRAATKAAIVQALKKLASRCKTGDIVYIHFSGHGQQMTDINGDEDYGWDQAWIPYDAYFRPCSKDRGEKHLCDDETAILLTAIRKKVGASGTILVVVDSCYSGDSTRNNQSTDGDTLCTRGVLDKFVIPSAKANAKSSKTPEQWLTLTACKRYESNTELPNGYGRLTYALYTLWEKLLKMDNKQAEEAIMNYMLNPKIATRLPQTPTLTGDKTNQHIKKALGK